MQLFTEVIWFYTSFFIQPFSAHNSKFHILRAPNPSLTDVKSLLFQAVTFSRKTVDIFFFTVHIQTYTWIQVYRTDREEEKEKAEDQRQFFDHPACRNVTETPQRRQWKLDKNGRKSGKVNKDMISKPLTSTEIYLVSCYFFIHSSRSTDFFF
ncbi:hypothetical protein AMECASPLE_003848 [Ameca splendens]|uniref:Uncharacterized protein n=1 Tax=Ameca splendens TaxID=208324 RepID=A0ABV0Z7H5_9TELE